MLTFFTIIHVVLCVFMIFVILLQPGKDAGMGAALGGGAATSAFGGRGAATFLTKLTAFCAAAYFLTSLGLSFVGLKSSVADSLAAEVAATAPAAAAPAAAPAAAAPTAAPMAVPSAPGTEPANPELQQANPGDPSKAVAPAAAPSGADAVPAQKLPGNP